MTTGNTLFLGTSRGTATDGRSSGSADSDDTANTGNENSVSVGNLVIGSSVNATVTANVPTSAVINGWIDFHNDGDWDDEGEHVWDNEPIRDGINGGLSIDVPSEVTSGTIQARFRLTETLGYAYFGLAPNGEVEDQTLAVTEPMPVIALGNRRLRMLLARRLDADLRDRNQNSVSSQFSPFTRTDRPADRRISARAFLARNDESPSPTVQTNDRSRELRARSASRVLSDTAGEDRPVYSFPARPRSWIRTVLVRFLTRFPKH